jgi:hypothetical protein
MASNEELAMRSAVTAWGRARWPDVRVLHELVLGRRRVDLLFVAPNDLVGVEIKSSADRLDRLEDQFREYSFYIPEVWVAIAPKWQDHAGVRFYRRNMLVVSGPGVIEHREGQRPFRDELVCSRLVELLWHSEALAIAQRTDVLPGPAHKQLRTPHIKKLLARLLTGNEIIREVCTELRARPLVGMQSDKPMRAAAAAPPAGVPA